MVQKCKELNRFITKPGKLPFRFCRKSLESWWRFCIRNCLNFESGVGSLFTITGPKINWFYPKISPLFNCDEKWLFLTYYPIICILWSFVLTRCCTPTWVKKILMRAISDVHAGCKFPIPALNHAHFLKQTDVLSFGFLGRFLVDVINLFEVQVGFKNFRTVRSRGSLISIILHKP